jgi:hypothetical protein
VLADVAETLLPDNCPAGVVRVVTRGQAELISGLFDYLVKHLYLIPMTFARWRNGPLESRRAEFSSGQYKMIRFALATSLLALSACDNSANIRARHQVEVEAVRDSLVHLNALEDQVYALVDLDRDTGRLVLVGSVKDLESVKREAQETKLDSCTGNARDELVLTVDHIIRGQTDAAEMNEALQHVDAYRRAAESCENWLAAQTPQ